MPEIGGGFSTFSRSLKESAAFQGLDVDRGRQVVDLKGDRERLDGVGAAESCLDRAAFLNFSVQMSRRRRRGTSFFLVTWTREMFSCST